MGLIDKLLKKESSTPQIDTVKGGLYAPITGEYIPLEKIPDPVFSQGVLGRGCGIDPEEGIVVAPVTGTIIQVADTKHAVGIMSEDGVEILIHVGIDTVDMNGSAFRVEIKEGDKVVCGQFLLSFDMAKIRAAGHPTTTAFIVTNSDDYPSLQIDSGKKYLKTQKIGQAV